MKKFIVLSFIFLAINCSYAMTVGQRVSHTADGLTIASGCSMVRMKLIYNTGGGGANTFTYSSWVTLNAGSYYDFSFTIPDGSTVVSKIVEFSFTLSSNTYSYTLTGTTNEVINNYVDCSCPPSSSKVLWIDEIPSGRDAALQYHIDTYLGTGGGC